MKRGEVPSDFPYGNMPNRLKTRHQRNAAKAGYCVACGRHLDDKRYLEPGIFPSILNHVCPKSFEAARKAREAQLESD